MGSSLLNELRREIQHCRSSWRPDTQNCRPIDRLSSGICPSLTRQRIWRQHWKRRSIGTGKDGLRLASEAYPLTTASIGAMAALHRGGPEGRRLIPVGFLSPLPGRLLILLFKLMLLGRGRRIRSQESGGPPPFEPPLKVEGELLITKTPGLSPRSGLIGPQRAVFVKGPPCESALASRLLEPTDWTLTGAAPWTQQRATEGLKDAGRLFGLAVLRSAS